MISPINCASTVQYIENQQYHNIDIPMGNYSEMAEEEIVPLNDNKEESEKKLVFEYQDFEELQCTSSNSETGKNVKSETIQDLEFENLNKKESKIDEYLVFQNPEVVNEKSKDYENKELENYFDSQYIDNQVNGKDKTEEVFNEKIDNLVSEQLACENIHKEKTFNSLVSAGELSENLGIGLAVSQYINVPDSNHPSIIHLTNSTQVLNLPKETESQTKRIEAVKIENSDNYNEIGQNAEIKKSKDSKNDLKKEEYKQDKEKIVKQPEPQKKMFTKYQPKVIPKKLQAKQIPDDDFFEELKSQTKY